MSQEAIIAIAQAEENAKQIRLDANAETRRLIDAAETAGDAAVEAAKQKAADELRELTRKADDKAKSDAAELARTVENKKASMRVKAEGRMDKAAGIIVERIVNG